MGITTYTGLVYPAQCDAMGHMNTQYYTAAFDPALWHLLNTFGYSANWIRDRRQGWVDVRHELNFVRELRAGELFRVESSVEKLGTTSLTTRHILSNVPDDETCAEMLIVSVYFDLDARKKIAIPEEVRRPIEKSTNIST
jgi:acyl-CoA thioester hydrolase